MINPILQALLESADELQKSEDRRPEPVSLLNGDCIARIVFKDEGQDEEGRLFGPAYAENSSGDVAINYGWITWKDADRLANAFGVELQEV